MSEEKELFEWVKCSKELPGNVEKLHQVSRDCIIRRIDSKTLITEYFNLYGEKWGLHHFEWLKPIQSSLNIEKYIEDIAAFQNQIEENVKLYYPKKLPRKFRLVEITQNPQSSLKEDPKEFFEKIISDRISYFQSNYHAHEAGRLTLALNAIRDLIPPSNFEQSSLTPKSIRDSDGWVSVKDRLPESGQKCILYGDGLHLTIFKFWDKGANGNSAPYFADMNNRGPITLDENEITHWRLLPAPPNEKSASLKPNKISDEELGKMAEEYFFKTGRLRRHEIEEDFIAGCKAIINKQGR